ncbi:MAG: hypothetical protein IJP92_00645 [Lachnospiraceae bacterium]|nr:hypothetical protein [Lachnospiraceae bacterium]
MKIVIDIPKETHEATCNSNMCPSDVTNVVKAIKDGTPLPKRHGRLIGADKRGIGMKDNEYMFYMISAYPSLISHKTRYFNFMHARDAAERFSINENRKYYVIECCMVCNTVAEIGDDQE